MEKLTKRLELKELMVDGGAFAMSIDRWGLQMNVTNSHRALAESQGPRRRCREPRASAVTCSPGQLVIVFLVIRYFW